MFTFFAGKCHCSKWRWGGLKLKSIPFVRNDVSWSSITKIRGINKFSAMETQCSPTCDLYHHSVSYRAELYVLAKLIILIVLMCLYSKDNLILIVFWLATQVNIPRTTQIKITVHGLNFPMISFCTDFCETLNMQGFTGIILRN